jgi:hypothetical protein
VALLAAAVRFLSSESSPGNCRFSKESEGNDLFRRDSPGDALEGATTMRKRAWAGLMLLTLLAGSVLEWSWRAKSLLD